MKRRNLIVAEPGRLEIVEEDLAEIPQDGLLLRTLTSGLSAGTELTFLKGDNPALHQRLDSELGLFVPSDEHAGQAYPVRRLGYMEVAEVVESRSAAYRPGEIVATPYGHATAHASDPVREHVVALPPELDPVLGVYAAHLGPICVNGLLHAAWDAAGPGVESLRDGVDDRGPLAVVVVTHDERPFLRWESTTWILDDAGNKVRPSGTELGFWRAGGEGEAELLLAHPTGIVEMYYGTVEPGRIELQTDGIIRSPQAKEYSSAKRMYGLVKSNLMWVMDMTAAGQPMSSHVSAELKRVEG